MTATGLSGIDGVLERAGELERTDWSAAIDLLVDANRRERSDEVEMALAALRNRSFGPLAAQPGPRRELPIGSVPDRGASGLAELPRDGLNAADVRATVLAHGAVLVRSAVDPDRADAFAAGIDRSIEAREAYGKLAGRRKDAPRSAWWDPLPLDPESAASLGRTWVRNGGGVLMGDAPRLMFEILEFYEELGLRSLVSEYLGGRPVLSANKCTLRRVTTEATGGWHQDGAFLGAGIRAINLWVSLSHCGVDAPGMDVVPKRFDGIVETGTGSTSFDWAPGEEVVDEVAVDVGVLRPEFEPGDLLIFDELYLHRTAVSPHMTGVRHAIEMWAFASDAYPDGQIPLVW